MFLSLKCEINLFFYNRKIAKTVPMDIPQSFLLPYFSKTCNNNVSLCSNDCSYISIYLIKNSDVQLEDTKHEIRFGFRFQSVLKLKVQRVAM